MTKVAILQSNYIPWKGYFDLINMSDTFVFHDDLQYTKNDWRNRNKIKTKSGLDWLTIPCGTSEKRLINEVTLKDHSWQKKHYNKIRQFYKNAPYYDYIEPFLKEFYLESEWNNLSQLNQFLIKQICNRFLGINTYFKNTEGMGLDSVKQERVIDILKYINADHYISGPSAKSYIDDARFLEEGISIEWMSYDGYPLYNQQHGEFRHDVSIIDLLANEGPNATKYMKSFNNDPV